MDMFLYSLLKAAAPLEFLALVAGMCAIALCVRRSEAQPRRHTSLDSILLLVGILGIIAGLLLLKDGLGISCCPYPEGY
jgi:hypothetical protein